MRTEKLNYNLPAELIVYDPPAKRGSSRLLIVDRTTGSIEHGSYADIPKYIQKNDMIVLNRTHVPKARVYMKDQANDRTFEVLFNKQLGKNEWELLIGGRNAHKGMRLYVNDPTKNLLVLKEQIPEQPIWNAQIEIGSPEDLFDKYGHVPLPPYIKRDDVATDLERYNTVFSERGHSAAAPTASLNLTDDILKKVKKKGAYVEKVQLDVGWGTFAPIRSDNIEEHHIHTEKIRIEPTTCDTINDLKMRGGRLWAFGTTVTRVVESATDPVTRKIEPYTGETDIYIYPGYVWKIVDVLVTNFHAPKTSLLALVSSFMGYELMMKAYEEAVRERYKFLSYGDSMLII